MSLLKLLHDENSTVADIARPHVQELLIIRYPDRFYWRIPPTATTVEAMFEVQSSIATAISRRWYDYETLSGIMNTHIRLIKVLPFLFGALHNINQRYDETQNVLSANNLVPGDVLSGVLMPYIVKWEITAKERDIIGQVHRAHQWSIIF